MQLAEFDSLAKARRYVATTPTAGLELLNHIRACWDLDAITLPKRARVTPSSPLPDRAGDYPAQHSTSQAYKESS